MPKSSSTSSKTNRSSKMPNMKQGTLTFTSVKRTDSAPDGKSQKRTAVIKKGNNKQLALDDSQLSEVLEISSDEENDAASEIIVPAKRTRASTKARSSPGITKRATPQPSRSEKKSSPVEIQKELLDITDKAGRYRKYHNEVRSKMGYIKPSKHTIMRWMRFYLEGKEFITFRFAPTVHSEGQNKIHQMLRFFDMSYEFGPCIGMTRLERWERAETLGLNPPVEVRDILLTKEGAECAEYAQCVLHGEV